MYIYTNNPIVVLLSNGVYRWQLQLSMASSHFLNLAILCMNLT